MKNVHNASRRATLLFLGFAALSCSKGGEKTPEEAAAVYAIKKTDIHDALTVVGVLEPKYQVILRSEVSGIVVKVFQKEGSLVQHGASILEVDGRPFQNEREKLMIRRKKAQLEYGILAREFQKDSALTNSGMVSERKLMDQRDLLEVKHLELQQLDIEIKDNSEKLEKTVLKAPLSGTLLSFNTQVGEIVISATGNNSNYTEIGTLANTDSMEVICSINEADFHSLSRETPVEAFLETDPTVRCPGRITFIAKSAKLVEERKMRAFEVRVDVVQPSSKMLPGINVGVEFVLVDKKDAMAVPASCVKGTQVKVLGADGKTTDREVKVGVTDFRNTEILEGMNPGEHVVEFPEEK